jgi:hypothetical protein
MALWSSVKSQTGAIVHFGLAEKYGKNLEITNDLQICIHS